MRGSTIGRRRVRDGSTPSIPYKRLFNFDLKADGSVGTADLPPLFNQRVRQGMWLHWDGNNNQVEERNKSAAIGAGATEESLDLASLDRVAKWALDLEAAGISTGAHRSDEGREADRRSIRRRARAATRSDGAAVGQVTPLAEIGTDPERLQLLHGGAGGEDEHDRHRPALEVLALPQDRRLRQHAARRRLAARALSAQRIRADAAGAALPGRAAANVLSRLRRVRLAEGGLRVGGARRPRRDGVRFDTSQRGNSNAGHLYGRDLPPADREALIEFLKTQ